MIDVTFITGNQAKADFLAKHLGYPIKHKKLDLDEIQTLNLKEIAEHKARQAYGEIKSPVLIEDAGLFIKSLGGLPGPFIKWFEIAIGLDGICKLANKLGSREAEIAVCFAYFDGQKIEFSHGSLKGKISDRPRGDNGFGFDPIFIRHGFDKTLAEMTDEELEKFSLRASTVYPEMKEYFKSLDRGKA